jgi:hypothetical protein
VTANARFSTLDDTVTRVLRRIHGGIFAVLIVATVATFAVVSPGFRDELQNSFVPQPIGFTELYFDTSRNGVVETPDGRQQVVVGFVIENRGEAHDLRYAYRVWAAGPGREVLAERTEQVVIGIDARREVSVLLDLPAAARLSAVEVDLLGRPERIRDTAPIGNDS